MSENTELPKLSRTFGGNNRDVTKFDFDTALPLADPSRHVARGEDAQTDFKRAFGRLDLAEAYLDAGRDCLAEGMNALNQARDKWGDDHEFASRPESPYTAAKAHETPFLKDASLNPAPRPALPESLAKTVSLARKLNAPKSNDTDKKANSLLSNADAFDRSFAVSPSLGKIAERGPKAEDPSVKDMFGSIAAAGMMTGISFAILAACLFFAGDLLLQAPSGLWNVKIGFGAAQAGALVMLVSVFYYARLLCGDAVARTPAQIFLGRGVAYSFTLFAIVMGAELEGGLLRHWRHLQVKPESFARHALEISGFMALIGGAFFCIIWEFWVAFTGRRIQSKWLIAPNFAGRIGIVSVVFSLLWLAMYAYLAPSVSFSGR